MLSRGALRCIVPACGVGMVAVVCGGVTWTAGIGSSENARNDIFRIFTKTIPYSPSNTSAHCSNHSNTTCGYNAPQCTSRKHPNVIRPYLDREKAKFPQNKEIINNDPQILTPPPHPKEIAGHQPTPRRTTAPTPTPQPDTMNVRGAQECVETEIEPTQTET